jgi:hypothetical protein
MTDETEKPKGRVMMIAGPDHRKLNASLAIGLLNWTKQWYDNASRNQTEGQDT